MLLCGSPQTVTAPIPTRVFPPGRRIHFCARYVRIEPPLLRAHKHRSFADTLSPRFLACVLIDPVVARADGCTYAQDFGVVVL